MRMTTAVADTFLLLAAAIWGAGFVAQILGANHVGPFGFTGIRFTLGTILLLPLLYRMWAWKRGKEIAKWLTANSMEGLPEASRSAEDYGTLLTAEL